LALTKSEEESKDIPALYKKLGSEFASLHSEIIEIKAKLKSVDKQMHST